MQLYQGNVINRASTQAHADWLLEVGWVSHLFRPRRTDWRDHISKHVDLGAHGRAQNILKSQKGEAGKWERQKEREADNAVTKP